MTQVQARLEARRMFGDRADAWYSRKFGQYVVGPKGCRSTLDGCFTSYLSWSHTVEKAKNHESWIQAVKKVMQSTSDSRRGM